MAENATGRIRADALIEFTERVFESLGVPEEDAHITAEVLVSADLRGVDSHGVARLRRYVDGIRNGLMNPQPDVQTITETPTTALIDAGSGLGQPVSYRAMERAIDKALDYGTGFVSVRMSNHFGIAGYYAMMALEHDCIGIAMTNSGRHVLPTFGRVPMLGTNPIAVAAPAGEEFPFVLDMATSTVPMGKLEVYRRLDKAMPLGWAADETGQPINDVERAMRLDRKREGGGLLPLGGAGETLSGHKGYGLALMVEILSGVLAGAAYSDLLGSESEPEGGVVNLGHFFCALRVDAIRPVDEFRASMDDLQRRLKNTPKAEGQDRVYVHGEKEYEEADRRSRDGIPLNPRVAEDLLGLSSELGVPFPVG
jgi:LDH2 family malate/lactate/ureidoglycolate dehydrogenase